MSRQERRELAEALLTAGSLLVLLATVIEACNPERAELPPSAPPAGVIDLDQARAERAGPAPTDRESDPA